MTIDVAESSQQGSSPVTLFQFVQGARRWTFTGGDQPVVYLGETYAASTILASEPDFSQEDASTTIEVSMPASNPIAAMWAGFPPTDALYVTVLRLHRTGQAARTFSGKVTGCAFDGYTAKLTASPLAGMLTRRVPALVYQTPCNWATYGVDCGVAEAAFTDSIAIAGVAGKDLFSPGFAARPDGWFDHGKIRLTTGDRAGDVRFIVTHVGNRVTLNAPFQNLMAGDTVQAVAGDDHLESTCLAKFNNVQRFLGFSRMPIANPYVGRMA